MHGNFDHKLYDSATDSTAILLVPMSRPLKRCYVNSQNEKMHANYTAKYKYSSRR